MSPVAQPRNRAIYPVGPRSFQKVDGMLAVVFGTFRNSGSTPNAFFLLDQALLRGHSESPVPTDARRPIFAQNQDIDAITDLLENLKDEFAGSLDLSADQIKTITVVELIKRCRLTRAP